MNSSDIRRAFIDFFVARGHTEIESAPLIPPDDPSLLFINAGMAPFKEYFIQPTTRPHPRVVSAQRCMRAGGKHNDLDNVGYTARHHTFFEMLGNFSFGDYFKREAIGYAWEFLTKTLGIAPEKLWITIHTSDDEAARIWTEEIGIKQNKLSRLEEDNFWQMGNTGPCGSCSEIYYDHGKQYAGDPPGTATGEQERYVEIWNLVFMQYERKADGTIIDLPRASVDTGMGLERIAAVMQNVHDNYSTDAFRYLIAAAAELTHCTDHCAPVLRVLADHIRAATFLIADGVNPHHDGRGYVLRRIIRRALRHGYDLGMEKPFFYQLVAPLVDNARHNWPSLAHDQTRITSLIQQEEEQFMRSLKNGMHHLEQLLATLKSTIIPGKEAFILYDTYGFPLDMTETIARERGLQVDHQGFAEHMEQQRAQARDKTHFSSRKLPRINVQSSFIGHEKLQVQTTIATLLDKAQPVQSISEGQEATIILPTTPFYPQGGGQVGDRGTIANDMAAFVVSDTRKEEGYHLHYGTLTHGTLACNDNVTATVDRTKRLATACNHSATHLLHAALRKVLGSHVTQRGSLVDDTHLRFDFSHPTPLTAQQSRDIEQLVNEHIRHNDAVEINHMPITEAKNTGALAFFGDKYEEMVRVLNIGAGFSLELCGGTHVSRTGDIALFKILSDSSISTGVRRIEALTATAALHDYQEREDQITALCNLFKTDASQLMDKVSQKINEQQILSEQVKKLRTQQGNQLIDQLTPRATTINGIRVLASQVNDLPLEERRILLDGLRSRLKEPSAVVIASVGNKKVSIMAGLGGGSEKWLHAGDLVQYLATQLNGKGGGGRKMAQGGGSNIAHIEQALQSVNEWVREHTQA